MIEQSNCGWLGSVLVWQVALKVYTDSKKV